MKLILDFDDVLFKAGDLKEVIFNTLASYGLENVREFYDMARKSGEPFSLRRFLYHVCDYKKAEGMHPLVDVDMIYEEIMRVCPDLGNQELALLVKSVGKDNCYIVTNGDEEFQRDKIRRAGMDTLVQEVYVVPGGKKEKIAEICKAFPLEEVIFTDDKNKFFIELNLEECRNLKTVIYNENGLENLKAEIEASRLSEQSKKKEIHRHVPTGPVMR